MEVYLVRHTETVCGKSTCYGQSDVKIIEPFNPSFQFILDQLPQAAKLYSSPLSRCALLSSFILSSSGITFANYDARLMEMNFGDWEMKNWDSIPLVDLNPWMSDFVNVRTPNGESFRDLHNRVLDFVEDKLKVPDTIPIILITHAGVIRSLLCKFLNLQLVDAFQNKVELGSVIKIKF